MSNESGLPSLLLQAAQSAAAADGLPVPEASDGFAKQQNLGLDHALAAASNAAPVARKGPMGGGGKKKGPPLRRGKWTPEEEAYANRLIQEFKAGLLPLTDGTTLRTFLSKLLNCDPMRISKKFVGSNCIGKQVFRRRTADINRLTPEQIQQSRAELSELERRFLERVAQTNRVKSSSGVGGGNATAPAAAAALSAASFMGGVAANPKDDSQFEMNPPSPPWLQPPLGYKQGAGAAMAAANLSGGESNNRAAAAGRALLQGLGGLKNFKERKNQQQQSSSNPLASHGSAGLLAMAELQRRASQQSFLQNSFNGSSASNIFAAAAAARGGSNAALAQFARNASAARMTATGNSMNSLMMKTGLSRDQLSQLARDKGLSSASLSNMIERQNSFDALMSLDFQSLQSIDNLANLIQTSGGAGQVPEGGMKNWSATADSRSNLAAAAAAGSSDNLSNAARRLASAGRMESLLRSLSSAGNLGKELGNNDNNGGGGAGSGNGNANASFSNLLQSMQSNLNNLGSSGNSINNFLNSHRDGNNGNNDSGNGGNNNSNNMASAVSLANLLRPADSSTGLTALRMQEGLNQRNSSVDDFLSLVSAGDIPHQDPSLLNIPLMQQQAAAANGDPAAAAFLAQRQLLARAAQSGSFANLGNASSGNLNSSSSAAALAMAARDRSESSNQLKRRLADLEGALGSQGAHKR